MKNYWIKTFRRLAAASVVAGSALFYSAMCYANALDVATNSPYADGWQSGDNGGTGFGAWSFNGTDTPPAGIYQGMTNSSPLGTSWTLATHSNSSGLANAGRAITGGLQAGQTFETVIQNPTTYNFYRGFDILFTNIGDNNFAGNNTAALRLSVFDYFNFNQNWGLNDAIGHTNTGLTSDATGTGAAGVKIDLTLTSSTDYSLTMTPLNGATPYTHTGTLASPITWVDYRLWDGMSAAPGDYNGDLHVDAADYVISRKNPATYDYTTWRENFGAEDIANNFEISRMSIVPAGTGSSLSSSAVPEPSSFALLLFCIVSNCLMSLRRLWRFRRAAG